MKKAFIILFTGIVLFGGCATSKWALKVIERSRQEYPAVRVVQYSIEDISKKFDHYIKEYWKFKTKIIFKNNPADAYLEPVRYGKIYLREEERLIFENPDNKYDIIAADHNLLHPPICDSSVYKLYSENAKYSASFHIHLQTFGANETKISVFSFNNLIPGGYKWQYGHYLFPIPLPIEAGQSVKPTGVEEKELLDFIVEKIIIKIDSKFFEDNDLPPGRCR